MDTLDKNGQRCPKCHDLNISGHRLNFVRV